MPWQDRKFPYLMIELTLNACNITKTYFLDIRPLCFAYRPTIFYTQLLHAKILYFLSHIPLYKHYLSSNYFGMSIKIFNYLFEYFYAFKKLSQKIMMRVSYVFVVDHILLMMFQYWHLLRY